MKWLALSIILCVTSPAMAQNLIDSQPVVESSNMPAPPSVTVICPCGQNAAPKKLGFKDRHPIWTRIGEIGGIVLQAAADVCQIKSTKWRRH